MCFSATASFTSGAALLIIGTVTVARVQRPTQLPFALIPILFSVQQLIEGALWLTFGAGAQPLNVGLTFAYSLFSHVLWPIYVPVAVLLIEPLAWRRKVLVAIVLIGAAVGMFLLYNLSTLPIVSRVERQHIVYESPHFFLSAVIIAYVVGTCVSSIVSSHRTVQLFGVVAFGSFLAAGAFYAAWFISVWCFFAAILSSIVLLHFFRRLPPRPGQAPASSRQLSA